ncbi:MFS transporter [Epilithonimonas hungarica]|uniref:Drug resistance transporter, EmrB/QacA subfamily n=1 Tax=Epilithonimonas hungarica TaxID=454006 RepID=A0A1G7S5I3_9FLAO|nr:MFS transporter [Epilithonimonas hungarica]SDG18253.1 drug resistance transporter, EmrB/QacA subfamily [Epilithonimonas hungarica]
MAQNSNRWLQHLILLTAPLLTVIDVFIVNIAIPSIKQSLNASDSEVELVIAFYLLGYASFMVTGSRAGDIFGRKKIFLWGMFLFVLTSCLCGMATSAEMLIAARFFQGVSGAFMMPQALAYVQVLFPEPQERTKAIGYVGITLGTASVLGQFLGGYFSSLQTFIEGWRFIFFINLPIGIIAFAAAKKYLINTKLNSEEKFDYSGVVLFTLALGSLIYPLTEGREKGYPLWSVAMIAFSLILFYIFIVNQKKKLQKKQHPLMDIRLFKIRDFNLGLVLLTFYFAMHTSYLLVSTIYFQNGLHLTSFQTGIYFAIWGSCFTVASFLSIRLVNAYGKRPIQFGVALMILVYLHQLIYFDSEVSQITLLTNLPLLGFGGGLVLPSLINLTLKNVPPQFVGIASGTYNTAQQTASSLGICLIGGLFFSISKATNDFVSAYHYSVYAEIFCLLIAFVILYFIEDFKKKKVTA